MLGTDGDHKTLNDWLVALPCEVELPAADESFFEKRGPTPTFAGDIRQFPRFHARSRGAIESGQEAANETCIPGWRGIYTKDVSRSGLAFLHSEQLFPGNRVRIVLADGIPRGVQVVHCRRIQRRCFEIGAIFVKYDADDQGQTPATRDAKSPVVLGDRGKLDGEGHSSRSDESIFANEQ